MAASGPVKTASGSVEAAFRKVDLAFVKQAYIIKEGEFIPTEWGGKAIDGFDLRSETQISEEEKKQSPELAEAVENLLKAIYGENFQPLTEKIYDEVIAFLEEIEKERQEKEKNSVFSCKLFFENYTVRLSTVQYWLNKTQNPKKSLRLKMREDFRNWASIEFDRYSLTY